jgi:hypothetical protein
MEVDVVLKKYIFKKLVFSLYFTLEVVKTLYQIRLFNVASWTDRVVGLDH